MTRTLLILTTTTLMFAGCDCDRSQRTSTPIAQTRAPIAQAPAPIAQAPAPLAQSVGPDCDDAFVGATGPVGPMGATGPQGRTGETGPSGYAASGPRGPAGPQGPTGAVGYDGAQGAAGGVAVGPQGTSGAAGAGGAQGAMGSSGAQGTSGTQMAGLTGPAGQAGQAGPTGARGATGVAGPTGPTLVGPAGPAGRAGPAGARGATGETGATGQTLAGLPGPTGEIGPAGERGAAGAIGAMGTVGALECWVAYREFWFDGDQTSMHNGDAARVSDIANYMRANPSLQIGLDGSSQSQTLDSESQKLIDRRVVAVREELIRDGISSDRIAVGPFGMAAQRRDGRIGVLIRSDPSAPVLASVPPAPPAVAERWTSHEDFWFDSGKAELSASDSEKVNGIAALALANQQMSIGIDNRTDRASPTAAESQLAKRRGDAVRSALIAAGVPAARISEGAFGDSGTQRDRRVAVLIRLPQIASAR